MGRGKTGHLLSGDWTGKIQAESHVTGAVQVARTPTLASEKGCIAWNEEQERTWPRCPRSNDPCPSTHISPCLALPLTRPGPSAVCQEGHSDRDADGLVCDGAGEGQGGGQRPLAAGGWV